MGKKSLQISIPVPFLDNFYVFSLSFNLDISIFFIVVKVGNINIYIYILHNNKDDVVDDSFH